MSGLRCWSRWRGRISLPWLGRFERDGERAVVKSIVHTLSVFRISDEPASIASANRGLRDVNHVLIFVR